MKKSIKGLSLLFMALVLVLGVTACNNDTEKKDDNKTEAKKDNKKADKEALAGDLSTFAYDIQVAISNADAPFATLGSYAGAEGEDYSAEDVKAAAAEVPKAASAFDSLTVPSSLKDYKDKIDASITDLKDAFTKRVDAAKAAGIDTVKDGAALATAVDTVSKDKASTDAFNKFQSEYNAVAKELGLEDMDFSKALELPFAAE
ncbi:MAG: hypothetical protein ACO1OC_08570 [Tuberibacillus sp.]